MKPSEMTDQELVRAWFVEVHGWQDTGQVLRRGNPIAYCSQPKIFKQPDGQEVFLGIRHNILDSESAFNEWVESKMGPLGFVVVLRPGRVEWRDQYKDQLFPKNLKDRRRLRAAVEDALEIWREKNE